MSRIPKSGYWLLPEGIEEILPPTASALDQLTRRVTDLFISWGYQLVTPPLIEYLDSLLTGTGEDLELKTFKVTDLVSGRTLGIRADTTPQVARIDAHTLKRKAPTRLCYAGTVLHTRSESSVGTRSPLQVGAELYGYAGIESDAEILTLMLTTLHAIGVEDLHIGLGHVGVFRGLIKHFGLDESVQAELFDILQRKSRPELQQFLQEFSLTGRLSEIFLALMDLHGGDEVLTKALELFSDIGGEVITAIEQLVTLRDMVRKQDHNFPMFFDLAELRGYHYHSGAMFAAYVPNCGNGIAFGGRYDDVGSFFGRARPATGFSMDLKTLMIKSFPVTTAKLGIFAPVSDDTSLYGQIKKLRNHGEIVVMQLPQQNGGAREMECDRELVREGDDWVVKAL